MSSSVSRETIARCHVQNSRVGKKLRDPLAPRAPPNCFLLYSADHREAVKMELEAVKQGTVMAPLVANELGKRWSMLSSEEKMKYEDKFKEEMDKYEKAMASYRPSEEFLMKVKLREESIAKKQFAGVGSGRMVMMKAYFEFVSENWLRLAVANYGLSPVELQRLMWGEWAGQGGNNVRKKVRRVQIKKDAAVEKNYEVKGMVVSRELRAISDPICPVGNKITNKSEKVEENYSTEKDKISSVNISPKKAKVDVQQVTKFKHNKPISEVWMETAFSLFERQLSQELRKMMPGMGHQEMSKSVKEKWREITEEQKEIFYKEMMQTQEKENI